MEITTAELGELQALMKKELTGLYPERELNAIVKGIFLHLTGLSTAQLVLEKERKLDEADIFYLQRALKRLKDHEPLQYITGVAHFHGLEFKVDKRVLIPRPETEELVQWVFEEISGPEDTKVLDIGTGSGCIAISISKKLPGSEVHAIDISEAALTLAKENASRLGADISFGLVDILRNEAIESLGSFDIIISNPPYVTMEDKQLMQKNVVDHEPGLALFVEEDPLIFYKAIIDFAKEHMRDKGKLFFECNEKYVGQVAQLLEKEKFSNIRQRRDMQGKYRMVVGTLNFELRN